MCYTVNVDKKGVLFMKIIPFYELYNYEFVITESLSKGQNWYNRNNLYTCIGNPKPSHTLLWLKNCHAKITDKNGNVLMVEKNQVAYMSKGIEYTIEFYDTAPEQDDSIVFHFQMASSDKQEISVSLSPEICIKNVDSGLALAMEAAAAEFNKNVVCVPLITSAIYQIFAVSCQRHRRKIVSNKYKYISKGIELIENNSDKSLNEIAEICGISEGYFRKLFKQYSGETPIDFRQKHRIEKAKQLLLLDTHSIGEIAEELHFSDIYHFSKSFKKFTGVSPQKYIVKTKSI